MCTANPQCQAYHFESSTCYEATAVDLVGAHPGSAIKKTVYIDDSLNKGMHIIGYSVWYSKKALQLMANTQIGLNGLHVPRGIVALAGETELENALNLHTQGNPALAIQQGLRFATKKNG